jgi:hypothetical protein
LIYFYIYDDSTSDALSDVEIEIFIGDAPEPVTCTSGSFGSARADIPEGLLVTNFFIFINHPGYYPIEHLYVYNSQMTYADGVRFFLIPLTETTPDPTPVVTPIVTPTPIPDYHQTWASFTGWDPVITFYHYTESFAVVDQTIFNTSIRAIDWGIPEISGTTITVNAQVMEFLGNSPRFKNNYTHEYHLGSLTENQTYTFIFKADSHVIKETTFTVQPSPLASPYPGAITDYDPTTSIKVETIGDITYADVTYLLFENEDIFHVVNPFYPLQGPVTVAGNSYSAQPEILRYEGSGDLASEERAVHYSVTYTLGSLIAGTYIFRSFSTEQDFVIEGDRALPPSHCMMRHLLSADSRTEQRG